MGLGNLFWIFLFFIISLFCGSCKHESEFPISEPVDFESWLIDEDSTYSKGIFKLDGQIDNVLCRSNFEILGTDTLFSFVIKIPKSSQFNSKGVSYLGFKLKDVLLNKKLDFQAFDSKLVQLSNFQFNSGETSIIPINFTITSINDDFFELNGELNVKYKSSLTSGDSFNMQFRNLQIEKSFVRIWVNGNRITPNGWEIDLKAGNEYTPEPTLAIFTELGKTMELGLRLTRDKSFYPIVKGEGEYSRLKIGPKKYLLPNTGGLTLNSFFYKDKINCTFSTKYQDTSGLLVDYVIDSMKINYSRISF